MVDLDVEWLMNNTLSYPRLGPSSNGKHAVHQKEAELLSMEDSGMSSATTNNNFRNNVVSSTIPVLDLD